jgi:hypothetical protein
MKKVKSDDQGATSVRVAEQVILEFHFFTGISTCNLNEFEFVLINNIVILVCLMLD